MPGSKISTDRKNALENNNSLQLRLCIGDWSKEDYMKVGDSKAGMT